MDRVRGVREEMVWSTPVMIKHKEIPAYRTCAPGVIEPKKLCQTSQECVTCSAVATARKINKDWDVGADEAIMPPASEFEDKVKKMEAKKM
eukprot:8286681-Heterocapsa_arctica.AAC.1